MPLFGKPGREETVPQLSESPDEEEINRIIHGRDYESGFYKRVYKTREKVVKVPKSCLYTGETVQENFKAVEGMEIAPYSDIYSLEGNPVIVQDRGEEHNSHWKAVEEAVEVLDRGLENSIVLEDAAIEDFRRFDYGTRNVDIGDIDAIVEFSDYGRRTGKQKNRFMESVRCMYDGFLRSISLNTDIPEDKAVELVTERSAYLNPETGIDTDDRLIGHGLEQRLEIPAPQDSY